MTQTSGDATRDTTRTPSRSSTDGVAGVGRRGPFARIGRFYREVVAELRKVIWPTRRELVTYTTVVIVFVSCMVAIVAGFDLGFARIVLKVFG